MSKEIMSTLGDILFGLIFYWIADLLSRQYFSFGGSRTLEGMHWTEGGWSMSAAWKLLGRWTAGHTSTRYQTCAA